MLNINEECSIRELERFRDKDLRELLEEYHRRVREVNDRIKAIRTWRGTKIKQPEGDWYEEGRSAKYTPHGERIG